MNKQLMALALAAAAAVTAAPAHASSVALAADGSWNEFDVDSMSSSDGGNGWIDEVYAGDFSALSFTFTIAAGDRGTLTVVDTGFAGDTFTIQWRRRPGHHLQRRRRHQRRRHGVRL